VFFANLLKEEKKFLVEQPTDRSTGGDRRKEHTNQVDSSIKPSATRCISWVETGRI